MCAYYSYYPIENALLTFVMPTQTGFFVFSYYLIENTVLVFVNHSAYIYALMVTLVSLFSVITRDKFVTS